MACSGWSERDGRRCLTVLRPRHLFPMSFREEYRPGFVKVLCHITASMSVLGERHIGSRTYPRRELRALATELNTSFA